MRIVSTIFDTALRASAGAAPAARAAGWPKASDQAVGSDKTGGGKLTTPNGVAG
ncbi:MAG: hypothetical protein LBT54_06515 [Bifidobacteriaceae bacterium]|jgi:hypothetical protein|nr:hypothetical protein [Bifidobacteriaceae bacterium]